jgi:hypothetical protein
MKPLFLAVLFMLLAFPAHSQNLMVAPKPKLDVLARTPLVDDKKFVAENGPERVISFNEERPQRRFNRLVFFSALTALGASKAYDGVTTRNTLERGGWENNPVYGRYPSVGRQVTVNAAFFAGESALFYATEHSRRRWIRWTGRITLMFAIEENLRLGVCNSKTFHDCHPAMPF